MSTSTLHTSAQTLSKPCNFHHHRVALTTGYMLQPCAHEFQDAQLCCVHNERGSPRMRATLDILREKEITTAEQDQTLRLALHNTQRLTYGVDFNTNFLVMLYLMQEQTGPVCDSDRASAKSHEARLRRLMVMTRTQKFDRAAIDGYAERGHRESSLPTRIIHELIEELRPIVETGSIPQGTRAKIDAVIAGLPKETLEPLIHPEESPWFQKAEKR